MKNGNRDDKLNPTKGKKKGEEKIIWGSGGM